MPDWWSWTAIAVGLLVACLLIPVVWLIVRRRWLAGRGRVFECSLKRPDGGWTLGVARFRGDVVWHQRNRRHERVRLVTARKREPEVASLAKA